MLGSNINFCYTLEAHDYWINTNEKCNRLLIECHDTCMTKQLLKATFNPYITTVSNDGVILLPDQI